jgi:hypothetical protein
VNKDLPVAVLGDYAGAGIKANMVGGAWQYVASPGGVAVGGIGWANPATGLITGYYQPNSFACFIHRESQVSIINTPGIGGPISSLQVLSGQRVIGYVQGEFWGLFNSGATPGQKVYYNPGISGTAFAPGLSSGAAGASVTASDTSGTTSGGNTLTGVGTLTGSITAGMPLNMAGIPAGTYFVTGGASPWTIANYDGLVIPNVATTAFTAVGATETQFYVASAVTADCLFTASLAVPAAGFAFSVLTVSAIASGVLTPGQWLSATGLAASLNVQILEQLTGTTGSTGTYYTTPGPVVGSTATFNGTQAKLGKISTWANWV